MGVVLCYHSDLVCVLSFLANAALTSELRCLSSCSQVQLTTRIKALLSSSTQCTILALENQQ